MGSCKVKIFFTADEHYGHKNIIQYCNRPYFSVEEMNSDLIARHNSVVKDEDRVIHVGDFTLEKDATKYIRQLNGSHTFLRGSHDYWMKKSSKYRDIWEGKIDGQYVVACHYAMRVWPRSHYDSWLVYGHGHGCLPPIGKQWDVGVDNNNFYPVSFEQLRDIINNGIS